MSPLPRKHFLNEFRVTNQHLHADDGEVIDLTKIFPFLRRNWLAIGLSMLVALLCATTLFVWLPERWQANATLEIGQIPVGASTTLIEPPAQAAERMKQRNAMNSALSRLAIPIDDPANLQAVLFRRTLKPTLVKNTNFIQIGISGYSPEQARDSLAEAAQTLIDAHNKIMMPILQRIQLRLQENDRQMATALAELATLKTTLSDAAKPTSGVSFAPHIVAVTELSNKEAQVTQIRVEREAVEDLLNPSRTFPTRIIDAVYVESSPSFPKLPLFLAVGTVLGFVLGIGVALIREGRARRKAPMQLPR